MKMHSADGRFAGAVLLFGFALGMLVSAVSSAQTEPAAPATSAPAAPPPARWTLAQLQQSFVAADADGNGELSRGEAQQLAILPRTFEELDRNKDGSLSPAEYGRILLPQ